MALNIVITGGAGFIGSEAVRQLYDLGHNIYNIDKLTYAACPESIADLSTDRYTFYNADITDKKTIKEILDLSKPDYIINFAAESHVDRSIDSSNEFIETNIIGTHILLEEALRYWEKFKKSKNNFKFLHISTDEVYGSLDFDDSAFTEDSPYRSNSPYSSSKASSDLIVRAWSKTFGLPAIITHSSNNYGPWQFPEKLIPKCIKSALSNEPIEIYGDGSNIRDWIHVSDNVEAILKILFDGENGEIYNIGSNNELTNLDLINKICSILELIKPSPKKNYSELICFVKDRPGHDLRYAVDTSKLRNELSWKPKINIEQGLKSTIKWMIDNSNWINKKSKDLNRMGLR